MGGRGASVSTAPVGCDASGLGRCDGRHRFTLRVPHFFGRPREAAVMAAVSSGPNAVLISRRVRGISLTYGCESEKFPVANRVQHPDVPLLS
jgi:hypothetical protein